MLLLETEYKLSNAKCYVLIKLGILFIVRNNSGTNRRNANELYISDTLTMAPHYEFQMWVFCWKVMINTDIWPTSHPHGSDSSEQQLRLQKIWKFETTPEYFLFYERRDIPSHYCLFICLLRSIRYNILFYCIMFQHTILENKIASMNEGIDVIHAFIWRSYNAMSMQSTGRRRVRTCSAHTARCVAPSAAPDTSSSAAADHPRCT
jgi:hypothetical protein